MVTGKSWRTLAIVIFASALVIAVVVIQWNMRTLIPEVKIVVPERMLFLQISRYMTRGEMLSIKVNVRNPSIVSINCSIADPKGVLHVVSLFNDGSHGDEKANDTIWTNIRAYQIGSSDPYGVWHVKCIAKALNGKQLSGTYRFRVVPYVPQWVRKEKFPLLANYFLRYPSYDEKILDELAKWDLLILDWHHIYFPDYIAKIRQKNPDIKILAYVRAGLFMPRSISSWEWGILNELVENVSKPDWWLRAPEGTAISWWPGSVTPNPTSEWQNFLPNFVYKYVMSTSLFDGVFYDGLFERVSYMNKGNIDIDNDGVRDSPEFIDSEWQKGMTKLLSLTRKLLGPDAIIVGNGGNPWSENSTYWDYANGCMQESFLTASWALPWQTAVKRYFVCMDKGFAPVFAVLATDTDNTGRIDKKHMLFGLTTALLNDGYYAYDRGDKTHSETWWFKEYDVELGAALGDAYNVSDVWFRDFENGIVAVNPTDKIVEISLPYIFEDAATGKNDSQFILDKKEGKILLKEE